MSCTIEVSEDGKYIIQTVSGKINRITSMQYNIDTHKMGHSLGIKIFLVDVTLAVNEDTSFEKYEFAYEDMQTSPEIMLDAKVATLVNPQDHSHDFIETVSRNSGLNVTIFRDRQKAIAYLLSD